MEDWAAVAKAINQRVAELGWPQGELAARSRVSRGIVREIQHHSAERRRSTRTLEALSTALGWDRDHLDAVLHGEPATAGDAAAPGAGPALESRIDELESQLSVMNGRIGELQSDVKSILALIRREP